MTKKWASPITLFLLGAATGGLAALLFAPSSGRELREKIGEGSEKLRAAAAEKVGEVREQVAEKYQETTRHAGELADGAKKSAEAYGHAVKKAVKKGKAAYDRELATVS
jgi:gas vesicle protein